jgi:aryl-alcohol dehydrogenase-like predicted oxidoreductase
LGGAQVFDAVQATWNLLERSAGPVLARAHQQGLGVIVKEALANGRLTPRNQRPSFSGKRERLQQEARKHSTTIDALALAAVLAQPWVDIVLSGAARTGHLVSNIKALGLTWDEELETGLEDLQESSPAYWETRSSLEWN